MTKTQKKMNIDFIKKIFGYKIKLNFSIEKEKEKDEVIVEKKWNYDFITLDTEFINNDGGIVSIGLGYWRDGKLVDTYYSLVCPENPKEKKHCSGICGITYEQIKNEKSFIQVWEEIGPTLENEILVGQSINNDLKQIEIAYEQCCGKKFKLPCRSVKDTFNKSLHLVKDCKHSLVALSKILGVEAENSHNALGDAITTGKVWIALNKLEHPVSAKDLLSEEDYKEVEMIVPEKQLKEKKVVNPELKGKLIAFTGIEALKPGIKKALQKSDVRISTKKGKLSERVDVLVYGNSDNWQDSAKYKKAVERGVKIIDKDSLFVTVLV